MFHSGTIDPKVLRSAARNWPLLLGALGAMVVSSVFAAARWGALLRAHDIRLSLFDLLRLVMTGLFFTLIAPGGVGGDVVKAWCVARGSDKRAAAATTVLLDRYLGLITLLLLGATVIALRFRTIWNADIERLRTFGLPLAGGQILILAVGLIILAMIGFALLVMSKRLRTSRLGAALSRVIPFRKTASKIYDAAHVYGDHPLPLLCAAGWSILAQSLLFVMYYLIGRAVGAEIGLWHCVLIVPPAMIIRFLPLVPGGAGQGLVGMALLFPLVGVTEGAEIGALGDVVFIALYLVGGVFFLTGKTDYHDIQSAVQS
jgi:glycosyltransferase 2 family protein